MGVTRKQSMPHFPKNEHCSPLLRTRAISGFFRKLVTSENHFWDLLHTVTWCIDNLFFLWHTMHCDRDGFFIYHKHPHSCHLFSRYYRHELFWKLILARHYLCSWNKVSLFSHWFLLNWNVFSVILVAKITLAHLLLR